MPINETPQDVGSLMTEGRVRPPTSVDLRRTAAAPPRAWNLFDQRVEVEVVEVVVREPRRAGGIREGI